MQAQHAELEIVLETSKVDAKTTENFLKDDAQRAGNEALSARMEAVRAKVHTP